MTSTRWSIDSHDGTILELNGRQFASNDDGAPMMCNLVCQELGRHLHVDYCRSQDRARCNVSGEGQHITLAMSPHPDRPKDWITHKLHWQRLGMVNVSP